MFGLSHLFYPWGFILQGLAILHFVKRRPENYSDCALSVPREGQAPPLQPLMRCTPPPPLFCKYCIYRT